MDTYTFRAGTTPLLVSIPHAGTYVPPELAARMTIAGLALPDTDWHVERLYAFATELGAGVLVATHSRYVVDLNRAADGAALYPGQVESALCPLATFAGDQIWRDGQAPAGGEVAARTATYWRPYHERLRAELDALRARHGRAVLWDAHSIASRVPALFDGELPVLNLGTWQGRACDPALERRLYDYARDASGYSAVLNGRFTGGTITRTNGDPARGVSAVQLELAQRSYLDEEMGEWRTSDAARVEAAICAMLEIAIAG